MLHVCIALNIVFLLYFSRFKEELARIKAAIAEKNRYRPDLYKYTHLDPDNISNSISI